MDFQKDELMDFDFILDNHSITNYKNVLHCSFHRQDGFCSDDRQFPLNDDDKVKFQKANPGSVCSLWK